MESALVGWCLFRRPGSLSVPPSETAMLQEAGRYGDRPKVWATYWRITAGCPCHLSSVTQPGVGCRWYTLRKMEGETWLLDEGCSAPGPPSHSIRGGLQVRPVLLTYKKSCPGLDVAVRAVQVVNGLGQVDAELLLTVGHLASGELTCHCHGPQGLLIFTLPSLLPWGGESMGVCSYLRPSLLPLHPGPSPGRSRGSGGH